MRCISYLNILIQSYSLVKKSYDLYILQLSELYPGRDAKPGPWLKLPQRWQFMHLKCTKYLFENVTPIFQ